MRVVEGLLEGRSYADIANSLDIAKSTVNEIVNEVREGEYDGIDGAHGRWDALRDLSKSLKKEDITLEDAVTGVVIVDTLSDLGVPIKDTAAALCEVSSLVERFDASDVQNKEILEAALQLQEVESEYDLTYDEAVEAYRRWQENLDQLQEEIQAARDEIVEAETARDEALERAEVTEADLKMFRDFSAEAADYGLAVDEAMDHVLPLAGTYESDELKALVAIHEDLAALDRPPSEARDAINQSLKITELGFDLDDAHEVVDHLADRDEGFEASLERIVDLLDRNETLETRNHTLERRNEALTEELESLEARIAAKEEEYPDVQSRIASAIDNIRERKEILSNLRDDIVERRAERDRLQDQLEQLGFEGRAIGAFLSFLTTREMSPAVARSAYVLHQTDRGNLPHLQQYEAMNERTVREWLVEQLHAFTDDEEVIAETKHKTAIEALEEAYEETIRELRDEIASLKREVDDQQVRLDRKQERIDDLETSSQELATTLDAEREARTTEQSIDELQNKLRSIEGEWRATQAVRKLVGTGDISKMLLKDLLKIKQGRMTYLESFEDRKDDKVREAVIDAFNELVEEDDAVISRVECKKEKVALKLHLTNSYDQELAERDEIIKNQIKRIELLESEVIERLEELT